MALREVATAATEARPKEDMAVMTTVQAATVVS